MNHIYLFNKLDASHQCAGAEVLGLSKENFNMFAKFAQNISESKDWCTYWNIDDAYFLNFDEKTMTDYISTCLPCAKSRAHAQTTGAKPKNYR